MEIQEQIKNSEDRKWLNEIRSACTVRIKELEDRAYAKAIEEAWNRIKNYRPGATLYFAYSGSLISSTIHYGDSMTVIAVQPRARRLWVRLKNGAYTYFDPKGVHRYGIQPSEPKPRTDSAIRIEKALAPLARSLSV